MARVKSIGRCGLAVLCVAVLACSSKEKDEGAEMSVGAGPPVSGAGVAAPSDPGSIPSGGTAGNANASTAGSTGAPSAGGSGGSSSSGMGGGGAPDSGSGTPDAGAGPTDAAMQEPPQDLAPIDPPVAGGCIDDVSAGDHTYTCEGIRFLTMVDEQCTTHACGLIIDVHGATMSGEVMRMNNRLHQLAPPEGYIAVAPTEPSATWDLAAHPPIIADFIEQMTTAFHLNTRRIHITGFSMGSGVTFWFLCNRPDLIASTGPVTGASADQVKVADTGMSCIESLDAGWQPRVPILFMSGTEDGALTIEAARARTEGIVSRLGLTGGDEIDGDGSYRRKRWTGADGMVFDFLEHDYSGAVAGHCIPGPTPDLIYGCTSNGVTLDWGKTVLQWFEEHPKP